MSVVDGYIPTPREGVGRHIDASEITRLDGSKTNRQRINISDPEDPDAVLTITRNPTSDDYGQVMRLAPNDQQINQLQELLYLILQELQALNAKK